MVHARLCETARPRFFFASPRHFDVLCCESETLNRFECERETLRFQKFESLKLSTYVSLFIQKALNTNQPKSCIRNVQSVNG